MFQYEIYPAFNTGILAGLKDVTVTGNVVEFSGDWNEKSSEDVLEFGNSDRVVRFKTQSKAVRIEDETAALLALGIDPEIIAELEVRIIRSANTIIDRHREQFTRKYLELLAKEINQEPRPALINHGRVQGTFGIAYAADVVNEDGTDWLMQKIYYLKDREVPEIGMTMSKGIKTKFLNYVSIGFYGNPELKKVGDNYIGVYDAPKDESKNPIVKEVSFITDSIGAQYGASVKSVFKSVGKAPDTIVKPKSIAQMKFEFNGKSFELSADGDTIKGLDALRAEMEAMKAQIDAFQAKEAAAKADLIGKIEVLQGETGLKLPGHLARSKGLMEAMTAADLQSYHDGLKAQWEAVNPQGQTKGAFTGSAAADNDSGWEVSTKFAPK